MIKRLEDFVFGKIAGRVIARLSLQAAAWAVGQAAASGVHIDANELSFALIALSNSAYTYISKWRDGRAAKAASFLAEVNPPPKA